METTKWINVPDKCIIKLVKTSKEESKEETPEFNEDGLMTSATDSYLESKPTIPLVLTGTVLAATHETWIGKTVKFSVPLNLPQFTLEEYTDDNGIETKIVSLPEDTILAIEKP